MEVVKAPVKTGDDPTARREPPSRRALLKALPLGLLAALLEGGGAARRALERAAARRPPADGAPGPRRARMPEPAGPLQPLDPTADEGGLGRGLGIDLHKIQHFDNTYPDDFYLERERLDRLASTAARLERAMRTIGHGHFNLVSFDDLLRYAERYPAIGAFPRAELDLLDELFYADASRYGFYGRKVIDRQTAVVESRDVEKIPATGHYLLRGEPLAKYRRIRRDLGDGVYLTSGVRGVVKQYQLFLSKAVRTGGNLSQASRSLAPPGYSYHAIGDFDVGRVGFGEKNFTADFAETPEYKRLIDLGYVAIRYTETNPYGVRHEPWHIKIA